MRWTIEDYISNLNHQLLGLSDLCLKFDEGHELFGLDICHKVRVLFHNTHLSHSLLHQLSKESEQFVSTATIWPERPSEPGVIAHRIGPRYLLVKQLFLFQNTSGFSYKPHLDATDTPPQFLDLNTWWEGQLICSSENSFSFSRKTLTLAFTNKLGGSHIDPNPIINGNTPLLPFLKLSDDILEWNISYSDGDTVTEANHEVSPFFATARQIAHEVFLSFQTIFSELNLDKVYFNKIASYRNIGYKQ
jgi:hypothetical protein